MNPKYLGDSYDLVKRFFCRELSALGYAISVDPKLTGAWSRQERRYYSLIGVDPERLSSISTTRRALFFDPDTGVRERDGKQHVSFGRIASEAAKFSLVFSFDQAFSRQAEPMETMQRKLVALETNGCHGLYYDSHARFLFVSKEWQVLDELRARFIELGIPAARLVNCRA